MEKNKDQKQEQQQQRPGDTSRTSNQGRKESSGGGDLRDDKRGDKQLDPDSKAPVSDKKQDKE